MLVYPTSPAFSVNLRRASILVWLFFTAASCGTGAPKIPDELLDREPLDPGYYPQGPYGLEVGDTLENFSFQGYRQPQDEQSLVELSFSDFYDPKGDRGINLLLLNTSAAWCQPCVIEHESLSTRVEQYRGQGLGVFSMLFQGPSGDPATESILKIWTDLYGTNFPMAIDPGYQMGRYGPAETPPLNLIVDPRDMTLMKIFVGNQDAAIWQYVDRELTKRNDP